MSDAHSAIDELEAYVMDLLDAESSERLERHVAGCPSCAAALQREAQLEIVAQQLVPTSKPKRESVSESPRYRWMRPLLGLAAAAALAVTVGAYLRNDGGRFIAPERRTPVQPAMDESAKCSLPIATLVDALAIPHASTGDIELVLTDHPASCNYAGDGRFENQCDVWRARIMLPASAQKPGSYAIDQSFAYLDQRVTVAAGAWSKDVCTVAGGSLRGTLVIERITDDRVEGSICGSFSGESDNPSLIDGRFVARRCPSCAGTGDACHNDGECCTNACVDGKCIP